MSDARLFAAGITLLLLITGQYIGSSMAMQDFDVNEELLEQERERMIEASLEKVRQQNEKFQRAKTGKCLNCEEKLPNPSASFCDSFCSEDYAQRIYAESQRVR